MKFTSILVSLFTFTLHVLCQTTTQTVSYDPVYDDPSESLNYVACSDGSNGLENKGYTTLGQLPNFPYVGGAYTVTGWNSPACGTCYNLTYNDKTISVLAVDSTLEGFNIAQQAMDYLTDGQSTQLGRVNAQSTPVDSSYCGF
ncbi:immunomodulatory protein [Pisolithus marmoratus]|nr:immunomodulatory protein [Pisolithus marmoratus]